MVLLRCACGWRGVPTLIGGERVYRGHDPLAGHIFEVVGAEPQTTCPVCGGEAEPDA